MEEKQDRKDISLAKLKLSVRLGGKSILLGGLKMAAIFAAGLLMPPLLGAAAPLIADTLIRRIRDTTGVSIGREALERYLVALSSKENVFGTNRREL